MSGPSRRAPGLLLLSLVVATLVSSLTFTSRAEAASHAVYQIVHPVHGDHVKAVYWTDTYGAPRSGGRSHIGVDIMGPKMIPLVAVADSVVTWGEFDNAGGNIVRIRDTNGWEFQYIHINNDTPGTDDGNASCIEAFVAKICNSLDGNRIQRGLEFKAGEVIAYLGDSGNAEWTGSHLHFEVYAPDGNGGVTAVNPTPYVDAAILSTQEVIPLPAGSPWPDVATAVNAIYQATEGRAPTGAESAALSSALQNGSVAEALAGIVDTNNSAAMVDRLYLIFFGRYADEQGFGYWLDRRGDGESLEDIAEWFAESDEFQGRYGQGTFEDFLNRMYRDMLFRDPDGDGNEYWLDQLERGTVNRGTIVVYFSEGEEATRLYRMRSERSVLEWILTGKRADDADVAAWADLRAETDLTTAIERLLAG